MLNKWNQWMELDQRWVTFSSWKQMWKGYEGELSQTNLFFDVLTLTALWPVNTRRPWTSVGHWEMAVEEAGATWKQVLLSFLQYVGSALTCFSYLVFGTVELCPCLNTILWFFFFFEKLNARNASLWGSLGLCCIMFGVHSLMHLDKLKLLKIWNLL